ncbi:MAG TPA: histidinol-phosphatase HisJ family protein [Pseudogracilibacillus sp.]|nr:histidinol-phosphatase HisJ family protein [Pseudogracilibacillus sp.]
MFDYHMHTNFSADSDAPMEAMIEKAIEKGFQEICFTEHVDYDYPDPTITFDLDVVVYDKKIKELQDKYADSITVKKGVEIGVQPHVLDDCEVLANEEQFDFIICSMHATDGKNLHRGDFFEGRTPEEAYEIYFTEFHECIKQFKQYSILGHLDLVKRYKKLDTDRNFHELIEPILKTVIEDGKGIEVNTSGFAYGLGSGMPSTDMLKLYKDCGGEIITVGSDAHEPYQIGHRIKETYELLQSLGFSYVATFSDRKPEFHKITNLL